jgi:outer membrane receptor protein involved in Fe transport
MYRGFRAPTLRELYRTASTRGGIILVNNPDLAPERLTGIEGGVDLFLTNDLSLSVTLFHNIVEDLVQNITRGTAGAVDRVIDPCGLVPAGGTCRELDNVGEMESNGLEFELEYRPHPDWTFFASYLYNDAEITKAPDQPQIEGNQVRQAPENQFTLKLEYTNRLFDTTGPGRYVGERYEDDLNTLNIDDFFLVDLVLARRLNESFQVFFSLENLFDKEYEIRRTNSGSVEIGKPRFVNLGLRYRR